MFCDRPPNCKGFPACPNPSKDGDPDVAGVGVVLGFVITSLITILSAMPIMLVSLLELIHLRGGNHHPLCRLLRIDSLQKKAKLEKKIVDFIVHITLGLSDQQLVTGITILITGYTKHCSMISRHFWIVFDLAFFSAVTHLASLPALREYFSRYHRLRDMRVLLMLANYTMLLVATVLTFRDYNKRTHDCPIRCTFNRVRTKRWGVSPVYAVQAVLLTFAFVWQLVMLYMQPDAWKIRHRKMIGTDDDGSGSEAHDTWDEFLTDRNERLKFVREHRTLLQKVHDTLTLCHLRKFIYERLQRIHQRHRGRTAYRVTGWIFLAVLAPPAPVVWAVLLGLWGLGLGRLIVDRQWSIPAENQWSFGQVLPLLLVVLPFFTVVDEVQESVTPELPETPHFQKRKTTAYSDVQMGSSSNKESSGRYDYSFDEIRNEEENSHMEGSTQDQEQIDQMVNVELGEARTH